MSVKVLLPIAVAALAGLSACIVDADWEQLHPVCTKEGSPGTEVLRCTGAPALLWQSDPDTNERSWDEAVVWCESLSQGGYDDWALPTISELRSFVRGSRNTMPWGCCGVEDDCLELACHGDTACYGPDESDGPGAGGCYWEPAAGGNCSAYWSSSSVADEPSQAWDVGFSYGNLNPQPKTSAAYVRCVRREP